MTYRAKKQNGYTLVELLITLALSAIIIAPFLFALNESLAVKTNTKAMNDLQQQSRFALDKLNYLITNDMPSANITNPSINPNSGTNSAFTGPSKYETALAGTTKNVTIRVCSTTLLVYTLSGNCGSDNQILASNVSIFTVDNLGDKTRYPAQYPYSKNLVGIRLKLQEADGPNSVDATLKVIPGGI
jgi:prepilin-type N-terminal cleavage/methylation domain-containing protein